MKKHIKFLPKKIKVGYRSFKVKVIESFPQGGPMGAYEPSGDLHISPDYDAVETVNTVLHELLHALCHTYSINEVMDWEDHDEEEKLVGVLGNGLTELMVRNPKLIKFLWESLHGGEPKDSDNDTNG